MGFAELMEAICEWPDGQIRDVMVIDDDGQQAKVIWNERVDNRVTGFDETVPTKWLKYVRQTTGRNDHTGSCED